MPKYKCTDEQEENNKLAYLKLRADYNKLNLDSYQKDIMFYTLVCHSFSNQIRFNSKNEFNLPYGKRYFNQNLQDNLEKFIDKLIELNIRFLHNTYEILPVNRLQENDFIYADPPYLITCATYNERGGWNEETEYVLLDLLDKVNARGVRFALSNVLESNGKSNDILKAWSGKYIMHRLDSDYGNANYHKKDKSKDNTVEVLITNY